jgi:predicted lipid-binding transport protein (Tim44 family)
MPLILGVAGFLAAWLWTMAFITIYILDHLVMLLLLAAVAVAIWLALRVFRRRRMGAATPPPVAVMPHRSVPPSHRSMYAMPPQQQRPALPPSPSQNWPFR